MPPNCDEQVSKRVDDWVVMAENTTVCTAIRALSFPLICRGPGGFNETPFLGRMRMKAMKIALLGTAALAAVSVSARADNLSDLKAQIEALNARVASIETSPALPAGYQAVSFSKVGNDHVISIMPTADMPASTVITWSGYVRAALVVSTASKNASSDVDIRTKAGFNVTGKTDTAVGEVGVSISTQATYADKGDHYNSGNGYIKTDGFSGWWKMTPNVTLSAGIMGSLSKNGNTYDAVCTCWYNDAWGAIGPVTTGYAFGNYGPHGDPAQFKLAYADGPIGLAVAVEDARDNHFGVTAKATYKMDMIGFDVSGGYWGNTKKTQPNGGDASWVVDAGVNFNFQPITVGLVIGTGHDGVAGGDSVQAGGYATMALGDSAHVELGVVHDFVDTANPFPLDGATLYNAGIYYTPASKLTIGVEAQYQSGGSADGMSLFDIGTKFMF